MVVACMTAWARCNAAFSSIFWAVADRSVKCLLAAARIVLSAHLIPVRFGPAVFTERMRQYSFSFHLVFRYTSSLYAYTCSCSFSQSSRGVSLRWETKWEKHMNNGAPTGRVAGGRAVRKSRSSDRQLSDVLSFSFVVDGSEEKPAGSSFVLLLNNRAPALLYY